MPHQTANGETFFEIEGYALTVAQILELSPVLSRLPVTPFRRAKSWPVLGRLSYGLLGLYGKEQKIRKSVVNHGAMIIKTIEGISRLR